MMQTKERSQVTQDQSDGSLTDRRPAARCNNSTKTQKKHRQKTNELIAQMRPLRAMLRFIRNHRMLRILLQSTENENLAILDINALQNFLYQDNFRHHAALPSALLEELSATE